MVSGLGLDPCEATTLRLTFTGIAISNAQEIWYELHSAVRDAAGNESNVVVDVFCGPDFNGGIPDCGPKPSTTVSETGDTGL